MEGSTYLLQGSLDVDALAPGRRRVGQTFTSIATAGDVNALFTEVLEGGCHDGHTVVGQRPCVLGEPIMEEYDTFVMCSVLSL